MNKRGSAAGGMGLCSTLTIVFIVLKLCRLIQWSWLWVLSPMWISAIIFGLILWWVIRKF